MRFPYLTLERFVVKFLIAVLFSTCLSNAHAGIEVRNGGGGFAKDGRYMTFQSAQVPIQTRELTTIELKSFEIIIRVVQKSLLNSNTKADLTRRILPSVARHYYKADLGRLDKKTKDQISDAYQKNMGISGDNFVLFALTDSETQTTALFPQFFTLKPIEQASILLHEALWTYSSIKSYEQVLQTEMAFQDYAETPTPSLEQMWALYRSLLIALQDIQQLTGIAYSLSTKDLSNIPVSVILGAEGYQCLVNIMNGEKSRWDFCTPALINNLALLRVSTPYNYFFEALYNFLVLPNSALTLEKDPRAIEFEVSLSGPPLFFSGPLEFVQQRTTLPLRDAKGQRIASILLR
ncbi:MAG: hypothetical protein ACKOX6_17570 [Bdellovibrio sp.]